MTTQALSADHYDFLRWPLSRDFKETSVANRHWNLSLAIGAAVAVLWACGGDSAPEAPPVAVTSSRADMVTSGDAMVEIAVPAGELASDVRVTLGGQDVTSQFVVRANGTIGGLVSGLAVGTNQLSASVRSGPATSVTLTNFSKNGPVLYAPQVTPWTCDSDPTIIDANCNRPAVYSFRYMPVGGTAFQNYDPASPPPVATVQTTTTDEGKSVPFIVRVETGIQGRDFYNIAVLFNPTQPWTPYAPQPAWNGKVRFHHGFGLGISYGPSNNIALTGGNAQLLSSPYALGKGYLVANAALNVNTHNGNLITQAEAMMMLKERIIKTYGPIRFTFGFGSSGGSIAQYQMVNAFPGIYDGIIVSATFPDNLSPETEIEDCWLLTNYFSTSAVTWSSAQKAAASGHPSTSVCSDPSNPSPQNRGWAAFNLRNLAGAACPNGGAGGRCPLEDYMIGVMGRNSVTGLANRPFGNSGVQYGLAALLGGTITPAHFVDLNANIGARNVSSYAWQAGRVTADAVAVQNSYRSGAMNEATNLNKVAIIDMRPVDLSGIHHQYRAWSTRERIRAAQGNFDNHVLWFNSTKTADDAHDLMNAWLTAVIADTGTATRAQKIVARKPASATDLCGSNVGSVGSSVASMLACTGAPDGSTRMGAGAGLADDVLSCQLKALDRASYPGVTFTDAQWAQMQATFPAGVCDYSKPGAGQQATVAWQRYVRPDGTAVSGGEPMPAASPGNDGGLAARGF